jgi:LacI family transcriptional regulator, repressor for deo operon, udp, cdd, tsx, nupC, and nupG
MKGPRGWPDLTHRIKGFRSEISRRKLRPDSVIVFPCASRRMEAGHEATSRLFQDHHPTALFCMNDATAIGSMHALREIGLRVPQDVSVVGFDNESMAAYSDPPLTTINQPRRLMGERAIQALFGRIHKERMEAVSEVLDVTLVERKSTCPRR